MKRNATANWKGSGKEGKGTLTTQSTVLKDTQYSYNSRFAEGVGTNPEELIAAAHAGCFTMKLSFVLGEAGYTADDKKVKAFYTIIENEIKEEADIWTDEFLQELNKRTGDFESGKVKGYTWEEVKARAKEFAKAK